MVAQITLVTGPARCGKTEQLLTRYRAALVELPPGSALWLAPTGRGAREVTARLLDGNLRACFCPAVMTFAAFAEDVVQSSGMPMRLVSAAEKRQLIGFLVSSLHEQGRLPHFRPIAGTTGLVDLVSSFISDLKRLEIWPEQFYRGCEARDSSAKGGISAKDRELAEIYNQYQDLLTEHNLYDAEGRFWSARHLLREGQRRPFEQLRLVVIDGFTDFTRTQHEILEILAGRVETMFVTLPTDGKPTPNNPPLTRSTGCPRGGNAERSDLFAKSQTTLQKLMHLPGATQQEMPARDSDWPAMDHLERNLFGHPRESPATALNDGVMKNIQVIGATQTLGEIQWLARKIKQLLVDGDEENTPPTRQGAISPGEIVVVFRSVREVAPLVREVCTEYGIPLAIDGEESLQESPLSSALMAVLRLAAEDWPFRRLLAVLGSNYLQPDWEEWRSGTGARAAARLVRHLQVPSEAEQLLAAASHDAQRQRDLAAMPVSDPEAQTASESDGGALPFDDESPPADDRPSLGHAILQRLQQTLARLPVKATPKQWGAAILGLAQELGISKAAANSEDVRLIARDRRAWESISRVLSGGDGIFAQLGKPPPQLDLHEYIAWLDDAFRTEHLARTHDDVGRVRVLSAPGVRTLSAPYLFFAGLSERAFPSPQRADRIYGEAELQSLRDAGLPFPARAERSQEEMLLFYEALTRATKKLWLSYPAMDDKAQPLLPSPYLSEVLRVCGPAIETPPRLDLTPLPPDEEVPLCHTTQRLRAVDAALHGTPSRLAVLRRRRGPGVPGTPPGAPEAQSSLFRNIVEGLDVLAQRSSREFGPYDGLLPTVRLRGFLAERFASGKPISISSLENYAFCPFRFMVERVMHIEPPADLALETDMGERGILLHDALAALHRKLNQNGGPSSPAQCDASRWSELVQETLAELAEARSYRHDEKTAEAALREIDLRLLAQWLEKYRQQHEKYDQTLDNAGGAPRPAHFEVSFGQEQLSADPLSTATPLTLTLGDQSLLLAGRVDRIDVGSDGKQTFFNIVDYKSGGKPRKKEGSAETTLQLELYALAVQQLLLPHALPWEGGYWYLRKEGYKRGHEFSQRDEAGWTDSPQWLARREVLVGNVLTLAESIRGGAFPVFSADDECTSFCPLKTVCRIHHVRALGKTWQPAP